MFKGAHDTHKFLNRLLRTEAVTTPPNITYCIYRIISFYRHLRQSIKVISNKAYSKIVGGSQTVPVWLLGLVVGSGCCLVVVRHGAYSDRDGLATN